MVKFKGSAHVILIAEPEESFDLNVEILCCAQDDRLRCKQQQ